ncbi:adenylyltransferase, partial [Acidithiobacillus ferrooxidans]|nr:adenylyltransferase [Acidithiobacillus ferrooxidans]
MSMPSIHVLTARQRCDLELLLTGAFAPLEGYLDAADWQSVLQDMRLGNGTLWPIPVVLDVSEALGRSLA